tara:strand:- start:128 stop:271 length:144 start_codon:yes stop_codon:yes gene_type:complete
MKFQRQNSPFPEKMIFYFAIEKKKNFSRLFSKKPPNFTHFFTPHFSF